MHVYLRHLANFARIVESGSMKAAADLLGSSPSGLSDSVRVLEARIGSPLLVRHRTGVTPTSEGERVFEAASEIVDLLGEALGAEEEGELSGPCRISVPGEVANTCMVDVIDQLRAAHPKLQVSVFVEDEVVEHGRFGRDYFLRISSGENKHEGLRELWTGSGNAIFVASSTIISEEAKDDVEQLSKLPLIHSARRKGAETYGLASPKQKITFGRSVYASQHSTRIAMAAQGLGITACLDFCVAKFIAKGEVRHVLKDRFSVPVSVKLLTPHKRNRRMDDPVISAFAAVLSGSKR